MAGGINPFVYALNDPIGLIDPSGLSVAGKLITISRKAWNHVFKRHVARKTFPGKSKFANPTSIQKNANRTVKNYDRKTSQSYGRTLYERDFGRQIGTRGETIQRVVTDKYGNVITTFPSTTFKSSVVAIMAFFLDFSDLIAGELAFDPEGEDTNNNGIADYMENFPFWNSNPCE